MEASKKDKEYFKKSGRTIEKIDRKRLKELSKLSIEKRVENLFGKDVIVKIYETTLKSSSAKL